MSVCAARTTARTGFHTPTLPCARRTYIAHVCRRMIWLTSRGFSLVPVWFSSKTNVSPAWLVHISQVWQAKTDPVAFHFVGSAGSCRNERSKSGR